MAEELLERVDKLQSRLGENQDPAKLLKTLGRLRELPMTVDILVETGVGKAVNSLRKHDIVGELAKSLVAKWKKLVPQTADRSSNSHHTKPQSHRPEERGHKRIRDPSPEPSPEPLYDQDQEEQQEEQEEEEEGYNPNYSPQYESPHRNSYQSDEYDSPQPEPSPPPPPPPPRKEPKQSSKPSKEIHKNHHHSRDRGAERRPGSSDQREVKKREVERERHHSPELKPPKHKKSTPHESKREEKKSQGKNERPRAQSDSPVNGEEEEFPPPSMSFESFLTYDAPSSVKKKKKPTPSSSSSSSAPSSSHNRPSHSSSSSSSSRPSAAAPSTPSSSQSSSSSSKVKKSNGSSKRPHSSSKSSSSSGSSEKRKKVVESVPTLPDIPLPAIQPNYRPLPSIEVTPLSPQRRKVAVCNDEEDAGFTGKRLNTKMVVFSGSKTSYLPRMMTLYEQCIRVLQNNIDSIAEVGGVPFEILEPVLERCTPEQLYRIEQSNQWFTEDSDELWMRHCKRDFKREQPQEFETWRELYLRLHDEREERLRLLTQKVSSAHANKPKGRQVKMAFVNSVVKPPRDVRRRQEKFGTSSGSSASSIAAAAPIKVRPVFTAEPSEPSPSSSSSFSLSSSSSAPRPSALSGASSAAASARDKPQVKKIAPMMAKTIKAFKNRFSRR